MINTPTEFKLTLNYVTPDDTFLEHESRHPSFDEALDEADEVAFNNVGFPLESWNNDAIDFGNGNKLFVYHPNEDDKTSRYRLSITSTGA